MQTLTFWAFGSTGTKQLPKTEKAALAGLLGPVLGSLKAGGRTAFFDTVQSAKSDMCSAEGRTLMLVALTDGADNSSKACDLAGLAAQLAKPGLQSFKFIGLAVGEDAKGYVEPLCKPQCCSLIEVSDGAAAITNAFGKALKKINQTTKITTERVRETVDGPNGMQQRKLETRKVEVLKSTRKQLPSTGKRKTKLCATWSATGTCPYNAGCHFAHGKHELAAKQNM